MIRASFCDPLEVRDILAQAVNKKTDRDRCYDLEGLISQGQCVKVMDDEKIIAAYVIKAKGRELWVMLASGRASIDLCPVMAELLEQHGREFDSIGFSTERAGLVKKAKREGYEVVRYIMRKKLK